MKKGTKILIIVLISILVLTIAGFTILYFTTGLFKTNKQMFSKYISQANIDSIISVEDTAIFGKRLLKEANSSTGKVTLLLKGADEEELSINEQFIFDTKLDLANKKAQAKIDIAQDGEGKLTINYLNNDDLYGIQFQDLIKQYIVIDNNNLKELAEKIGIEDTSDIPDKIELLKDIDEEDEENTEESEQLNVKVKDISRRYLQLILDQIPEENFSKIKKEEITVKNKAIRAGGYRVTLNQKELIDIIIEVLNEAKQDKELLALINSYSKEEISEEEYREKIQTLANKIDRSDSTDDNYSLSISVYKQGSKLVKVYAKLGIGEDNNGAYIDFSLDNNKIINVNYVLNYEYNSFDNYLAPTVTTKNSEFNFSIEKDNSNGQEEGYRIYLSEKNDNQINSELELTFSRFGKYTSQKVKIDITLNASFMNKDITIIINDNTVFSSDEEIGKFKEGEYAIINNFSNEEIANLVLNLKNMIFEEIDASKSLIGSFLESNSKLFMTAEKSIAEKKKDMVKEAIALTKAEIIADYYGGNLTEITEEQITEKIATYLADYDISGNIELKDIGGMHQYIISVEGIELDEDSNKLDLSILDE